MSDKEKRDDASGPANDDRPAEETTASAEATGAAPSSEGPDAGFESAAEQAEAPETRIAALEEEVTTLKDKLMRAVAETENIRRRSERDKQDTQKYAVSKFAQDMISVADNLRRALESVPEGAREDNEQLNSLLTGVEMTEKELLDALSRHGVRKMEPLGEKFDPNHHQAVVEVPDSDYANGQVAQVLQPGYMIHDRVLRAAMVGVAKGGQKQESQKADAGQSA